MYSPSAVWEVIDPHRPSDYSDHNPEITPTWAHMLIMVRYLARRASTNGAQNMASQCQELMQYSWPGYLDTRVRGETAI